MPYAAHEVPSGTEKVPKHGQAIYRSAFNAAVEKYGEKRAHALSWAAVKQKYKKKGDRWISKDGAGAMPKKPTKSATAKDASACPNCGGDGVDDDGEVCETCGGDGYVGLPASVESVEDRRPPPDDDDDDDDDDQNDDDEDQNDGRRIRDTISLVFDKGSNVIRKSGDGYLVASARIARTGIQLYDGSEVGRSDLNGQMVRVYRPPEEVFSNRAMRSLAHKPITLDHPPRMVHADNWDEYAIGHIGDEVVRDGDTVRVPMVIMDGKAIRAYERDGVKELSVGYSTELKWGRGKTPDGDVYDAVQTAIRGNHLAVVPAARGGSKLRIGDNGCTEKPMIKTMINGQTIEFDSDLAAKHVQDYIASMQTQLADAKKKDQAAEEEQEREKKERAEKDAAFAALKGENAVLKKQLEDKSDAKVIDAAVNERIDLLLKADAAMEGKATFAGKPDAEIRRTVVMAKMGDAAKELTDAEMIGAFKAVTANLKPRSGTDRLADSLALLGQGGGSNANDPRAIRDAAYSKYVNDLQNAWKQPARTA